jgi:ADP-ribose pyrophosphatase YjhB (NUDIX family)
MSAEATEIIVRAVIRRDGQLLLARERTKPWSFLPGGHVEPGERIEVALMREIAEELGTPAKITGLIGVVGYRYVEDGMTHHELNLVFVVELGAAEPVSQKITWSSTGCPSTASTPPTCVLTRSRTRWWPPARTEPRSGTPGTAKPEPDHGV